MADERENLVLLNLQGIRREMAALLAPSHSLFRHARLKIRLPGESRDPLVNSSKADWWVPAFAGKAD